MGKLYCGKLVAIKFNLREKLVTVKLDCEHYYQVVISVASFRESYSLLEISQLGIVMFAV